MTLTVKKKQTDVFDIECFFKVLLNNQHIINLYLPPTNPLTGSDWSCFMDIYQFRLSEGIDHTTMNETARKRFKSVYEKVIKTVSDVYLDKGDKILEVGAGALNVLNVSYLSTLFRNKILHNITYSDANPATVRAAWGRAPYIKASLETLVNDLSGRSYDAILGCSVFDTIKVDHLFGVFKQVFTALKPGGKVFIFSPLQPFYHTIFSYYSKDPDKIVFPRVGEDALLEGVQYVSREVLEQWLTENSGDDGNEKVKEFMRKFAALTPLERDLFCSRVVNDKLDKQASDFFKKIFDKQLINVDNTSFYEENMHKGLLAAGFYIRSRGFRIGRCCVNSSSIPPSEHNYFIEKHGRVSSRRCYVLPPVKCMIHSYVHVIVAKR